MTQLAIKVTYQPGETPASFCSRLAAINGRQKARHFCDDLGFSFQRVVDGEEVALSRLAYLGNVAVEVLRGGLVRKTDVGYDLGGQLITRTLMVRNCLRFCPECLAEDLRRENEHPKARAWGRKSWLVSFVRTCEYHGASLVEGSVQQEPALMHDFAAMVRSSTREICEISSASVRRDPSLFERYLLGRLAGDVGTHPFLDSLPFYAAARFTELLGAVALRGLKAPLRKFTEDDWWEAGAAGFAVTSLGEESVRGWLSELQAAFTGKTGYAGGRALYGRLYETLAHDSDGPAYDPVRQLIRDHAIATLPLGPGDELFGPVTERRWHSIHSAAKEFEVHPKRLRKLLVGAGLIAAGDSALTNGRILVEAAQVAEFIRESKDTIDNKQAQELVNAPRVHWKILVDGGYVKPHVKAGQKEGLQFRFRREAIVSFVECLLSSTVPLANPDDSLCRIPDAAKRANCSAAEILDLLLAGKLERACRDPLERGYMAVLVDPEELRRKTMLAGHGGISLREVERSLKASTYVVKALIEHGHLPARTAINPVNRCPQMIVMPEGLARFQQTYVSLTNLAKERGQHFSRVKRELCESGMEAALDPSVIGSTFYRRSDVDLAGELTIGIS
jgi:hypothetical protein